MFVALRAARRSKVLVLNRSCYTISFWKCTMRDNIHWSITSPCFKVDIQSYFCFKILEKQLFWPRSVHILEEFQSAFWIDEVSKKYGTSSETLGILSTSSTTLSPPFFRLSSTSSTWEASVTATCSYHLPIASPAFFSISVSSLGTVSASDFPAPTKTFAPDSRFAD